MLINLCLSNRSVLLLPGDYRAGATYGDRLTRHLFRNGRVLSRSGMTFKSTEDFKSKLSDAQQEPIFKDADKHLSRIMKERGVYGTIRAIQVERAHRLGTGTVSGTAVASEADMENNDASLTFTLDGDESDSDEEHEEEDPLLLLELVEGEEDEEKRVKEIGNGDGSDDAPTLQDAFALEFAVTVPDDNNNSDDDDPAETNDPLTKRLPKSSQLARMARETTFLLHGAGQTNEVKAKSTTSNAAQVKRRRSMSADELAAFEASKHGFTTDDEKKGGGSQSEGPRRSKCTRGPGDAYNSKGGTATTTRKSKFREPKVPRCDNNVDEDLGALIMDSGSALFKLEDLEYEDIYSVASSPPLTAHDSLPNSDVD